MSDIRVHFISVGDNSGIIIAGSSEADSIAQMIIHVFTFCGLQYQFNQNYSESNRFTADIAVLTGIATGDYNEFPDFEDNLRRLRMIAEAISERGTFVYCYGDDIVRGIANESRAEIKKIPYDIHGHFQNKLGVFAATHNRTVPLAISGEDNMRSLSASREACMAAGVSEDDFYNAMMSFKSTSL